jgi:nucleoside-diphosphate-sugar epimerase
VKILVTGASGFVGGALCTRLVEQGMTVIGAVRRLPLDKEVIGVDYRIVPDMSSETNWSGVFTEVDVVVHCAARVHVMQDTSDDPILAFRKVNVEGTVRLARQAVDKGLKRFIFISSLKVNGEFTEDIPFQADDIPEPTDPYGLSKWEAEQALREIAAETALEVVIIRPPLVYGQGVRANFLRLMQAIKLGLPLPLGAIKNFRSLVALDNLVDLIANCLDHPAATNQTFLVSDGEDLSTPELLRRTALAMKRPVRLLSISTPILVGVARFLGKADFASRLCSSLQADINKTRKLLRWSPPVSVDGSLQKTTDYFLSH